MFVANTGLLLPVIETPGTIFNEMFFFQKKKKFQNALHNITHFLQASMTWYKYEASIVYFNERFDIS